MLTLFLRRLVVLAALGAPCSANALLPEVSLYQVIYFEPGSAALTSSMRARIAEWVKDADRLPDMLVVVGTKTSEKDNVALRNAQLNAVFKQLQAGGVSPKRIRTKLENDDTIQLRQQTEVTLSVLPGTRP